MKSPASNLEVMNQVRAKATNLEVRKENQSHNHESGIGRKIALGILALATIALPAAAQNQGLTSFTDNAGDHIYTQHGFGLPNNHDVFQVDPEYPWVGDMNQLYCSGGNPPPYTNNGSSPSPVASYTDPAGQHLLYIDNKMHVHDLEVGGSCMNLDLIAQADLQPPFSVPVSDGKSVAAFDDANGEHAFYTGVDGHVHQLLYSGTSVLHLDLTALAGLTPSSPCGVISSALTAFSDSRSSPNIELVYYVGSTNHLCELASWQGWGSYDLTAMCSNGCGNGAPRPMLRSPLTGFTDPNGQHVFYLDVQGHVWEFTVSNTLATLDLTKNFGGISAVADALISLNNTFGPQVFYVDASQHVNQINPKTGLHQKLSGGQLTLPAMSGCSSATSVFSPGTSLSSIGSDAKGGEDVFYVGADTHIWQIHSGDGRAWSPVDLTQTLGFTTSFGTSPCYIN